jgi:hypothetical protein
VCIIDEEITLQRAYGREIAGIEHIRAEQP